MMYSITQILFLVLTILVYALGMCLVYEMCISLFYKVTAYVRCYTYRICFLCAGSYETSQKARKRKNDVTAKQPATLKKPVNPVTSKKVRQGKEQKLLPDGLTSKQDIKWSCNDGNKAVDPPQGYWQQETDMPAKIAPGNPISYFLEYLSDEFFEQVAEKTNIYALQKGDTSFRPTNKKEIKVLFGLHISIGVFSFSRIKLYWSNTLKIQMFRESMTKNRFFKLRNYLHVVNNLNLDANDTDKFKKVRPMINSVLAKCKSLQREKNVSVDEQIIPFKGTHAAKQYNPNKPSPWGLKVFVLCGANGSVYNFLFYQGKSTELNRDNMELYGLGPSVVLHLIEANIKPGSELYFDNYFSSYNLMQLLKMKGIRSAATARVDRFAKPPFSDELKNKPRGAMQEVVSCDRDVVMVRWMDNKPVNMVSNFVGIGDVDVAKRWEKREGKYIDVERPEIIKLYNKSMGGVDKMDFLIAIYRTFIRSRKWPLRVIFHLVDVSICNSWLEYRTDCADCGVAKKDVMDLLAFRMSIVDSLLQEGTVTPSRKRGRPSVEEAEEYERNLPRMPRRDCESRPTEGVRNDPEGHFPIHCGKKEAGRCKKAGCKGRSHFRCERCKIYLCLSSSRNCFRDFHVA